VTTAVQQTAGRTLIAPNLFDRLTHRITTDHHDIEHDTAQRILDQALAFLAACATTPQPIGPSDLVDIGWHTFILYTRDYAQFCDRIAGRFIHHAPDDQPGNVSGTPLSATIDAIRAAGYRFDPDLWPSAADCSDKNCNQCYAGCTDSPNKP